MRWLPSAIRSRRAIAPAGLAIDPKGRLYSVCENKVMIVSDPASGKVLANIPIGGGTDGVAFDDGYAFSANGADGTITMVGETSPGKFEAVATIPTQRSARTIAADQKAHKLYLPAAEFGPPPAGSEGKKGRPPGDLAYVILGDQATPEKVAALRAQMGLDLPIWQRYLHWLWDVLHGDLGRSFRTGETVLAAVPDRLPVSIELMVMAEVMGLLIGIPLAILCAVKSGSALDRFLTGLAFGKLSLPSFMVAILLIYLFAVELNWLPATGWVPFTEDPLGNLRSFVLPALTLAFAEWPVLMRVLRSDMIATLQEDYIAMAKAKGLRPARILLVHALKPSSLTLVTVTGINIGRLIGGALIVETIFALPGIGRLLVGAIYARDFIILQGVVLFVAAGFVVVNFIVDMLYAVLDPRIRHGRA